VTFVRNNELLTERNDRFSTTAVAAGSLRAGSNFEPHLAPESQIQDSTNPERFKSAKFLSLISPAPAHASRAFPAPAGTLPPIGIAQSNSSMDSLCSLVETGDRAFKTRGGMSAKKFQNLAPPKNCFHDS
jgi:hypothetical protein